MNGTAVRTDGKGHYGILAINNVDANFTSIDNDKSFFYATYCYINIPGEQQFTLIPNHLGAGEVTSINETLFSMSGLVFLSALSSSLTSCRLEAWTSWAA